VGICHVTLLLRQSASITFRERKKSSFLKRIAVSTIYRSEPGVLRLLVMEVET